MESSALGEVEKVETIWKAITFIRFETSFGVGVRGVERRRFNPQIPAANRLNSRPIMRCTWRLANAFNKMFISASDENFFTQHSRVKALSVALSRNISSTISLWHKTSHGDQAPCHTIFDIDKLQSLSLSLLSPPFRDPLSPSVASFLKRHDEILLRHYNT